MDLHAKVFHHPSLLPSPIQSLTKTRGLLDSEAMGSVVNSISRFIHLVSCWNIKAVPIQDCKNMVSLLKRLKPVLDEIVKFEINFDEVMLKEFEVLDNAVNKAREFMEKWSPKMSKISVVLRRELLLMRIWSSLLQICHILNGYLQSFPSTSHSSCFQRFMQDIRSTELKRTSELIEAALNDQGNGVKPKPELLMRIAESIDLTSSKDLLTESIVLEKEKENAKLHRSRVEVHEIGKIIDLVVHMRDCMFKHEKFALMNGIRIPSYFRCPLSLTLMQDPVIVASGQTYERVFIQKWLDQGLRICPITFQTLSHTNIIPNYTVKAMIANWCEMNSIGHAKPVESHQVLDDIMPVESFCSSHSDSTSRSSLDVGNISENRTTKDIVRSVEENSRSYEENSLVAHHQILTSKLTPKHQMSLENSCSHSRSVSNSSTISSVDYTPTSLAAVLAEVSVASDKYNMVSEVSAEVISDYPDFSPSSKDSRYSQCSSGGQFHRSCPKVPIEIRNGTNHQISSFSGSGSDDSTTYAHVQKLVDDLKSQFSEFRTAAAAEIRLLTKHNMENRAIIANCGAIPLLVSLLYSKVKTTQENAVTALLNLSINDLNKAMIAEAGVIEPLIHVLRSGNTESKENSAATLFSLSVLEDGKIKIGRSGAVKALVDLLGTGSLRGKKDAAAALFNLSIFHENKACIVQAGAVKYLIQLMDPGGGMADKAMALLANLVTISEGRVAITREGGIPLLVEFLETGSQRGKENAASALFQLCISNNKFCRMVLQEGAVPPLVALSQSGTPRAKEKAQQLLSHFRSLREGHMRKVKS